MNHGSIRMHNATPCNVGCGIAPSGDEELTDLERLRMRGLGACGFVGVIYCLDAIALAYKGPAWWSKARD